MGLTLNSPMKRNDMITMLTTLSWMLSSGVSVSMGVEELLSDPNNKMNKKGLEVLRDKLDEGEQLSDIFKEHEDLYGTGRWRQIAAAEMTGKVPECLLRIADQIRNSGDIMGKIRNAVIYPAIIMVFALAAGYYMFTTVVPQMKDMLAEFDVELPLLTQMVMAASEYLISNSIFLLGVIVGVIVFIRWLLTHSLKFKWHRFITRLPFVGQVSINMNYSLMYTLLSDMIENGAHVVEALRVAAGSATNVFIMNELLSAADSMEREGIGITEALISTKTMPSDDKLMLRIGSETNRELELLSSLSVRRREAAYASVNTLMEIMPTLVLLVVAAVVAVMVIAIYMPMISLATDIA